MIRNTSVLLFISILLIMIDLVQLSSEYEKHSTESELHNDNSFDRTIFDREDRKQESASKSLEEDIIGQIPSVDNDNASEIYELSQEGNLYIMSSIAILFFPISSIICFVYFDSL